MRSTRSSTFAWSVSLRFRRERSPSVRLVTMPLEAVRLSATSRMRSASPRVVVPEAATLAKSLLSSAGLASASLMVASFTLRAPVPSMLKPIALSVWYTDEAVFVSRSALRICARTERAPLSPCSGAPRLVFSSYLVWSTR